MTERPIIGITMGDPVGIGPEILVKAFCRKSFFRACRPLVLGDVQVLSGESLRLATGLAIKAVADPEAALYQAGRMDVVGLSELNYRHLQPAIPTQKTGRAMVKYITQGVTWAMAGRIAGLATGPINKTAMRAAGFPFQGHTELLAEQTHTRDCVMMLAGTRLRVALVTIHLPLSEVAKTLSTRAILKTIRITEKALRESFGIAHPKLSVAALNPHGGEGGLFGREEARIIAPALRQASDEGIRVSGPHPPDTLFYQALQGKWDAVIAMYHDQGLIPFKMIHFHDGVNTTLGLPIVRTSVDHGTAYDIAGKDEADPGSLMAAVEMAAYQARKRQESSSHSAG
jgi:4-hydroxythreonine-4-phosphate dehydrogenase